MTVRRALDMGFTPATKRRRTVGRTTVVYRGTKGEMKTDTATISHSATAGSNLTINEVPAGTAFDQRIGAKIKIWRIQCMLQSSLPVRVDLVIPKDIADLPSNTTVGVIRQDQFTVLGTYIHNPNQGTNAEMFEINHKLPMGLITRYDGSAAADIVQHKVIARLTTPATTNVTGYFRIWYTDV